MLSAAVQRRLQAVIREELSFLSRRSSTFSSADQAVTCIMVHLASVASADAEAGGPPSSGDDSDESVRPNSSLVRARGTMAAAARPGAQPRRAPDHSASLPPPPPFAPQSERDRRVEHLRAIFGLSPADAERVAILGDELRRQHRIVSRLSAGSARTAGLNADRRAGDAAGAFRRDAAGAGGAGAGGGPPVGSVRGGVGGGGGGSGGPMLTTPGEIAELTMLAAVDRLCDKLRSLRGPAPAHAPTNAPAGGPPAWPPLVVGAVHGRSWSPGSVGAVQPKRARIMASPLPPPPPPPPDDDTDANTDGERAGGGNNKRARLN
jgi:hypothetical protein